MSNVVLFRIKDLFDIGMCSETGLSGVSSKLRSKAPIISLSKKAYPHCSVLVVSRNRFKHD